MNTFKVIAIAGMLFTFSFYHLNPSAQELNAQSDLSNSARIKIVSSKLEAMTAEFKNDLTDEMQDTEFVGDVEAQLPQQPGCGIGIGNVVASQKVERDVIIVGDVINICR